MLGNSIVVLIHCTWRIASKEPQQFQLCGISYIQERTEWTEWLQEA